MGYETDRFTTTINDNLICTICQEVLENPMECSQCQTNFCSVCIEMWSARSTLCPNRCELKLQKSHKFVRSELEKLTISCINKELGCDAVLSLEMLKKHEEQECSHRKTKCSNAGCDVLLKACELIQHENSCIFRGVTCENCQADYLFSESAEHNCLKVLSDKLMKLKFDVRDTDDKIAEFSHLFLDNDLHFGVKCQNCGICPLKGPRNICCVCPNYSLCWKCKNLNLHKHTEYYVLNKEGYHAHVSCDGCGMRPLFGLRYKCSECDNFGKNYIDFCHFCRNSREHQHTNFIRFPPYLVNIRALPANSLSLKLGSQLLRGWKVYNEGIEPLKELFINCISGDCCSMIYLANSPSYELFGIIIKPKESKEIFISDIITQRKSGYYKSEWKLWSNEQKCSFGPILAYEVYIIS